MTRAWERRTNNEVVIDLAIGKLPSLGRSERVSMVGIIANARTTSRKSSCRAG